MIKVYNAENGDFIGKINEEQHELLIDKLEEENSKNDSYYIDSHTIDYLTDTGADEDLLELLKTGLAEDEGIQLYIEDEDSSIAK